MPWVNWQPLLARAAPLHAGIGRAFEEVGAVHAARHALQIFQREDERLVHEAVDQPILVRVDLRLPAMVPHEAQAVGRDDAVEGIKRREADRAFASAVSHVTSRRTTSFSNTEGLPYGFSLTGAPSVLVQSGTGTMLGSGVPAAGAARAEPPPAATAPAPIPARVEGSACGRATVSRHWRVPSGVDWCRTWASSLIFFIRRFEYFDWNRVPEGRCVSRARHLHRGVGGDLHGLRVGHVALHRFHTGGPSTFWAMEAQPATV